MKVKILIVDDHPAIRTTMYDVMESEGFHVELAENGKKAIELFLAGSIRVERVIELIRAKFRSSVLVFIENKQLCQKVMNEIKKEGFNLEISSRFDDTLIRIRQIDYNFLVIDEDSPSIEQEGINNTIKISNSDTEVVQINEDEATSLVTSRMNKFFLLNYTIQEARFAQSKDAFHLKSTHTNQSHQD